MMNDKIYNSAHGRIYYQISKLENKPWLVFLHGLTADNTLFEKQIEYFKDKYSLMCWDTPCHAKSRPYDIFDYSVFAEDLNNIFKAEEIRIPILIGQSMGGYIVQSYLKRYPYNASGFIGIDTCPFGEKYYSNSDKWWLSKVGTLSQLFSLNTLINTVAGSSTSTPYGKENMTKALSYYTKKELCSLLGAGYSAFLEANCDMLIKCPVLILVGKNDRTGKVISYCREWHSTTGYPLEIISNAAHNSNIDNPKAVNTLIEKFAETVFFILGNTKG